MMGDNMPKTLKNLIIFLLLVASVFIFITIYPSIITIINYMLRLFIPFIIAFCIAYILQPVVLYFQKYMKKRILAVILALVLFAMIVFSTVKLSFPFLIKELKEFIANYDHIITGIEKLVNNFAQKFNFLPVNYQPTFDNLRGMITDYFDNMEIDPLSVISKVIDYASIIVIIPMTLVYFLIDYEKIICYIRNKLIEKNHIRLKNFLGELNRFISQYVKTTFVIMIIMMILSSLALWAVGLDYPLFFGAIIAVTNIIPYLGPYIGGAFPVLYALIDSPQKALIVLVIIVVVQLIETNIISPYLYSRNNELHPILVIMGLVIFGKIFGIIGMIISVPLIGMIRIAIKHYPIEILKSKKKVLGKV